MLDLINRQKSLKGAEVFNSIERINSDNESTDTDAIQQKYTLGDVMRRLERNLEIELDNG